MRSGVAHAATAVAGAAASSRRRRFNAYRPARCVGGCSTPAPHQHAPPPRPLTAR